MISPRYCAETDDNVPTPSDGEGVGIIAASSTASSKMALIRSSFHSSPSLVWYARADDSDEKDCSQREKIRSHRWSRNNLPPQAPQRLLDDLRTHFVVLPR
jgi:hypothetical protein